MGKIRRWYIYGICAISLQALAWAVISLLRNLVISPLRPEPAALAFQIAVIVVSGPLYAGHWLWARRLATRSAEEREATLRSLYLYGMMAGFLGPILPNLYDVLRTLAGISRESFGWPRIYISRGEWVVYHLIAALVLGVFWLYHWLELRSETEIETDGWATVRRLYWLGFSAAGLTTTTVAVITLARWLMMLTGRTTGGHALQLYSILCQLVIGAPVWLIFWLNVERLGQRAGPLERESALRQVYLYLAVFIGSMGTVSAATALLAGYIRRLVRWTAPSWRGPGDYREALSYIIGLGVLWAYHAYVIGQDARKAERPPQQITARQVYFYLVAGVGLAALAIGLAGEISVLVHRVIGHVFGNDQREAFSWFTAAIIAGLPVYIVPWRQVQAEAREGGLESVHSRRSTPRKVYLYFFLFVAALVDLGALIFILYRLISSLLGGDRLAAIELAQAIGYAAIAAAIWVSHQIVLRGDRRLLAADEKVEQESLRLAVVDTSDGRFGQAVIRTLADRIPGLEVDLIDVGGAESQGAVIESEVGERLKAADLILAPWTIIQAGSDTPDELARAVAESPALKFLVPTRPEGWEWVGVDRWHGDGLVRQAVHAVRQAIAGRPVKPRRPMGAAAIAWIVVGVLILLSILGSLITSALP